MALNMIEVIPIGGRWHVRRIKEDALPETIVHYRIKAFAMIAGRAVAIDTEAELVIKNKDGSIGKGPGARQSYGHDSPDRPG